MASGSETCAGLICVTVAAQRVDDKAKREAAHQAAQRGQQWLTQHFTVRENPPSRAVSSPLWHFYYLRNLERAARLTGQSRFGDHDWRKEGVALLLNSQDTKKGCWKGRGLAEEDPVIATSLALLFLTPQPPAKPR
jgi:hypothetical protein